MNKCWWSDDYGPFVQLLILIIDGTFSRLGEQVAVFRAQTGKAHVVDAYCPHLGANLAVGGRVLGDCIECPFHGWKFQGSDGKCVQIPYAEKGEYYTTLNTYLGKSHISSSSSGL